MIGAAVVAAGGPLYSVKMFTLEMIPRPSWRRGPFGLWRDPLQFLALGTLASLALGIGDLSRLPTVGGIGFWTAGSCLSMFLGLMIGQVTVYRILRNRIAAV
jgi:hypothetical protein